MAYSELSYTPIGWKNRSESLETPLGKNNLNKMDLMIYNLVAQLQEAYNELNIGKLPKADANGMVSGVDYNSTTGIFTFHFYGTSATKTVDLNIEKIPVSFSMDANGVIKMKTADGTEFTADISRIIPILNFVDGSIIDFTSTKSGQTYTITATIKEGSIEGKYLQPNYLSDVTTQAGIATAQATNASNYASNAAYDASLARSYSIGGSGVREGENTDNAKYYKEQTAYLKNDVIRLKADTEVFKNNAATSAANAYTSEANAKESEQNAAASEANASASETNALASENEARHQAELSESYAKGKESVRAGSNTDNAYFYMTESKNFRDTAETYKNTAGDYAEDARQSADDSEQSSLHSKSYKDEASGYLESMQGILEAVNAKMAVAEFSVDDDGNLVYTADTPYMFVVNENGDLEYQLVS